MSAEDDIVLKIITTVEGAEEVEAKIKSIVDSAPKEDIKFKVTAEGADQAVDQTKKVDDAVKGLDGKTATATVKVDGAEKALADAEALKARVDALGGESFAQATQSISRLGSTAEEAFTTAGAAAQKFGASANELRSVQSTIEAIGGRARDSSVDFAVLANRYDQARGVASSFGTTAATAMAQAETAAAGLGSRIAQLGATIAQSFGSAASNFLGGIGQEFDKVTPAADKAGQAIHGVGTHAGFTRGELREVSLVLRELELGPLANVVRLLGGAAISAGPWIAIAVAVAGFSAAMVKFADAASEAAQKLGELQKVVGGSFENLSAMQEAFAAGGTSAAKFGEEFGKLAERVREDSAKIRSEIASTADAAASAATSVASAEIALEKAKIVASQGGAPLSEQQNALFRQREATIAVQEATVRLAEAQRKQAEAAANNLGPVIAKYNEMAKGIEQTFDPLTTMETKVKAITAVMAESGLSVEKLGKSFVDAGEGGQAAFFKLADIFHNISDEAERMALGKKLGLSPETIETLSKGSAALKELIQHFKDLGLVLDQTDKTNLSGLKDAANQLSATWDALKNKMGALASPAVTSFFEGLRQGLEKAAPDLLKLAEAFGKLDLTDFGKGLVGSIQTVAQAILGLIQLWQSFNDETGKSDIKGLEALSEVGRGVIAVFQEIDYWTKAVKVGADLVSLAIRRIFASPEGAAELDKQAAAIVKKWQDYNKTLEDAKTKTQAAGDSGKDLTKIGQGADTSKDKVVSLQKELEKLQQQAGKTPKDAAAVTTPQIKGTDESLANLEQAARQTMDRIKQIFTVDLSQLMTMKWDTSEAQKAADEVKKIFEFDLSKSITMKWDTVTSGAEDAVKDIKKAFEFELTTPKIKWDGLVNDAEKAAKDVEKAFKDINIGELKGFSFDPIIEAGKAAVQAIEQAFQNISIAGVTLDFSGVITAGQEAAMQLAQTIQTLVSAVNFTGLVTAAQQAFTDITTAATTAFTALVTAAGTAVQGINTAIGQISFDGLIAKINDVVAAFGRMEKAANDAAQAASSAAASGAGGYALGGLFRGRPGRDTNLAWLTDYEFVMRPEAVLKYGVDFMRMINGLQFPAGGFRSGGLNRAMQTISGGMSAFRDGGLVMPRIMVPAFAAGGFNAGGGAGGGAPRARSARPLNLTIGGETFKGLTVPEDTAKALERAAIGRQTSSTGTKPRWVK